MPGNGDDANGRSSRYAPNAPSGSAPPMTIDCARRGMIEQDRTRRGHEREQRARGRARTHHRRAPGAGERRPRIADARPGLERTDLRYAPHEQRTKTEKQHYGQHDRDECREPAHTPGRFVDPYPRAGRHLGEALPRVDPFEHEPAQTRAAADHEVAHVAVVDRGARAASLERARRSSPGWAKADIHPTAISARAARCGQLTLGSRARTGSARTRPAGPRSSASAEYDLKMRRTRARVVSRRSFASVVRLCRVDDVHRDAVRGPRVRRSRGRQRGAPASRGRCRRRRGTSRDRSRRARGRGRRARASPRARRRTRRGRRRAVPGRPRPARSPRTGTP